MIPIEETALTTLTSLQTSADEENIASGDECDGAGQRTGEELQQVIHALDKRQQDPIPTTKTATSPPLTIECRYRPAAQDQDARAASTDTITTSCPSGIQILSGEKPEKSEREPERVSCLGASAVTLSSGEQSTTTAYDVEAAAAVGCTKSDNNNILTSLLARIDKVKRETNLLATTTNSIMPEIATNNILPNKGTQALDPTAPAESLRYDDSDSSGLCWTPKRKLSQENEQIDHHQGFQIGTEKSLEHQAKTVEHINESTLHILQYLAHRRNELKEIDKQLSLMMTQYLTKLESSGWPKEYDTFALRQQTYQSGINKGAYDDEQTDDAIDLSLESSRSSDCRRNQSGAITNDETQEEKKKSSITINLKKSRLLGTVIKPQHEQESVPIIGNHHQHLPDQASPLNLLKSYESYKHLAPSPVVCRSNPTSVPNSTHTYTPISTFSSTPRSLDHSTSIYYLGMQQGQQQTFTSITGNAALAANFDRSPLGQISLAACDQDHLHHYRTHHKKFRANCSSQSSICDEIYNISQQQDSNVNMLAEAEIEALSQSQALRQQQQLLLSEFYSNHHLAYAPVTLLNDRTHYHQRHLLGDINGSFLAHTNGTTNIRATSSTTTKPDSDFNHHQAPLNKVSTAAALEAANDVARLARSQLQKIAYRCHVCGSGFEDRHRLQQHLSIHLNLDPSWFEERTIKETMAQYESKRGDYLCDRCDVRFETTAEFDRHMGLHGEKPHRCELCSQDNKSVSFRYYRQLLTHLRSHCFIYSCRFAPDCKQTANRKDYLKLHILKHHLNNKLPEQYTICCH